MEWLIGVAEAALVALILAWLLGWCNRFVWSPGRCGLAIANCLRRNRARSDDRFRFVLCWLENDRDGDDTKIVGQAFSGLQGVSLDRSARSVKASGAADEWRPVMQRSAHAVLHRWKADLAIVGLVKKPGEVLSLWFIPRTGDGTLERGDQRYVLEDATLGRDFHDDLQAQLAVRALAAISPLADSATRGRVLNKELRTATEKLSKLTTNGPRRNAEHQAAMDAGLATALVALGREERSTELFERAITGYRAALEVFTRKRTPSKWSLGLNDLGVALVALAEREEGTQRLEEAINCYRAALEVRTRERAPIDWALTQNNLGVALATVGEREGSAKRLEEAIAAYRAALEVRTRERGTLDWAMTQNNLGNALARVYRLKRGRAQLDEAIAAYRAALEEWTRDRVPLQWAKTMGNLGGALVDLGKLDNSKEHLQEAVDCFYAVLEEHQRDRLPFDWAKAQINLGVGLRALAQRESDPERFVEAIKAYRAALKELSPERTPLAWATAQSNLGNALSDLATYENSARNLEEAVDAYTSALEILSAGRSPDFRDEVQEKLERTVRSLHEKKHEE